MTAEQVKAECEHYVRSGDAVDLNEAAEIVADWLGLPWGGVFAAACGEAR